MRASLVLLILFFTGTNAAAKARGPGVHQSLFMAHLLKRCNAGVGRACFAYGHNLELAYGKSKREERISYVHRACTLAYAKACDEVSPSRPLKFAKRPKRNSTKRAIASEHRE